MKLVDLKYDIENHMLNDDFLIFVSPDDNFLAEQYLRAIAACRGKTIQSIESLSDLNKHSALSLVMNYDEYLNVIRIDTFSEYRDDYFDFKNCIVLCKKLDKKFKDKNADYIVNFPKLLDWQIKDYMNILCPGLSKESVDWLYAACRGNIHWIDNELAKLNIFPEKDRLELLTKIASDKNNYLYIPVGVDQFDLFDKLFTNDFESIINFLEHESDYNIDAIGMANMMLSKIKLWSVQSIPGNISQAALGPYAGQAYHAKKSLYSINSYRARDLIKFLSTIDIKLRTGDLDISKEYLLDYILCHILAK